ncbi:Sulfotransferase family protein [Paenibacillus sp. yr247]|nr:Sulfotransferase family protein [Paenibacillus sp. yr247]
MRIFFVNHNENESEKELLIFLHVPKTGGQTLGRIIDEQYHISEIIKVKDPQTVETLLNEIPNEKVTKIGCYVEHLETYFQQVPKGDEHINCIYGHMYFGMHRYLSKPYTYMTMLREPIDRVISHYYYFLGKNHFKTDTSFEEFITKPKFFNFQTRYLSGGNIPDLQLAKENIHNHFSIVGITEMFDESLFLMKKQFGWEHINYAKKNVTASRPAKEQISKVFIDLIVKHNEIDIELYHYAKNLLELKIQALDHPSKQELHDYIRIQQNGV